MVARSRQLQVCLEASMVAVLAFIIALVPLDMGTGLEIELGVIPITIFSYRRGWRAGFVSGFIWGGIKLASGDFYLLSILQVVVEYILAFGVTGLAGLASKPLKKAKAQETHKKLLWILVWSLGLGLGSKYFIHFIAGAIYWGIYAPDGMNVYLYSLLINGASLVATYAVCFLSIHLVFKSSTAWLYPK